MKIDFGKLENATPDEKLEFLRTHPEWGEFTKEIESLIMLSLLKFFQNEVH